MEYYEKQVSSERVFTGRIINVRHDTAKLHTGKHVFREVMEHPGGVTILPVDSDNRAYMVRQFRYPFMRPMLEAPAGKLEAGEAPLTCAIRELREETGFAADNIIDFGPLCSSPGISNEVLHLYLATGLTVGKSEPDIDEFLTVEAHPMDELIELIMSGEICDAKTVALIFKAKQYLRI